MSDLNEEPLDRSPNVRSLIKNFERTLSPVNSFKPKSSVSLVRNPSIEENNHLTTNGSVTCRVEECEIHNESRSRLEDPVTGNEIYCLRDMTRNDSKFPLPCDSTIVKSIPSHVQSPLQDVFIKQREEVIKGLKERFKSNHLNNNSQQIDLTVEIPLDSPVVDLDSAHVDIDVEHTFTLSFDSVHEVSTPLSTRYGNVDYHFSSLVKHCQIAMMQLTPKKMRDNIGSTRIDEKADDESPSAPKCHPFGALIGILKKIWNTGFPRLRAAVSFIIDTVSAVMKRLKEVMKRILQGLIDMIMILNLSMRIIVLEKAHLGIDGWAESISLLLSMIASIYPTVPRANTAINCFRIFNYFIEDEIKAERRFHIYFLALTLISFIVNLSWLLFPYYTIPLSPVTDILAYNMMQEKSTTRLFCWYCLLLSTLANIILPFFALKSRTNSRNVMWELWNKSRLFLPVIPSHARLKSFKTSLPSRFIAITWLHLLSSLIFFSIGLVAHFQLGYSPIFATSYPFLTLNTFIYIKAGTCFAFVLTMLHNIDFCDFFAEFGCINPCHIHYRNRRRRLLLKRGFQGPAVLITSNFILFSGCVKLIDEVAGVFMWISLSHAQAVDSLDMKQIKLIIGLSHLSLLLCDTLGLLLVITAIYSFRSTMDSDDQDIIITIEEMTLKSVGKHLSRKSLDSELRSPSDFSFMWKNLPSGKFIESIVTGPPSLDKCLKFLEMRNFIVIASGVVDQAVKVFAFALKDNVPGLAAVEIDTNSARIELKCREERLIDVFIRQLAPEELFGGKFYRN